MIKTLGEDAILATHDEIIVETGGLSGVCPDESLAAALHRIDDYIYYENVTDLHEIAALYAIAIAQGHVFNDGNKRTALIAIYDFFEINKVLLNAPPAIEDLMVDIAEKRISRAKLADWLRCYTQNMRKQKDLISNLTKEQQKELFHHMNYLNMEELKIICSSLAIPYSIYVEMPDGTLKKTANLDRKGIILNRIKQYLITGNIKRPSIIPKSVVCNNKLPVVLKSNQKVFYGQYKNKNESILQLLKNLTDGKFEFGAIAQEVIRSCWVKGHAPTYKEFANMWLDAKKKHDKPNPEWAYLTDRKNGVASSDWKKIRLMKAQLAMKLLKSLT